MAEARPRAGRMLAVTAVWGACFLAIRLGLRDSSPLWFASLRGLVAGVALLAFAAYRDRLLLPHGAREWGLIAVLGLANVTLGFGAMFVATAGLATGVAAVLSNAQPLLIPLPARFLYGERLEPGSAAAIGVGFVGLAIVTGPGGGGADALVSLLAASGITAGTLLSRRLAGSPSMVSAVAWHFLLGSAALALVALAEEGAPSIRWTPRFVAIALLLGVLGTAVPFMVWFREALRARLALLAAWTFLVPAFGLAFGALFLGEVPRGASFVGVATLLGSLWILLRPRAGRPAEDAASDLPME